MRKKPYDIDSIEVILRAINRGRMVEKVEPGYQRLAYYRKKWDRSKEATLKVIKRAIENKIMSKKVFLIEAPGIKGVRLVPVPHYKVIKH